MVAHIVRIGMRLLERSEREHEVLELGKSHALSDRFPCPALRFVAMAMKPALPKCARASFGS